MRTTPLKTLAILAAVGGIALLAAACSSPDTEEGTDNTPITHQTITAEAAHTFMADGAPYILVDVRTIEEFQTAHIPGALLLPLPELRELAESELPDKTARIFLYCRSGRRSAEAANLLVSLGYTNVYDFGGIENWPFETISTQ